MQWQKEDVYTKVELKTYNLSFIDDNPVNSSIKVDTSQLVKKTMQIFFLPLKPAVLITGEVVSLTWWCLWTGSSES